MAKRDLDAILAKHRTKKGPRCSIAAALRKVVDTERATVQGWIDDHDIKSAEIARAMSEVLGEQVGAGTIGRHRRGDCGCAQ